jgi:hypothetical protein
LIWLSVVLACLLLVALCLAAPKEAWAQSSAASDTLRKVGEDQYGSNLDEPLTGPDNECNPGDEGYDPETGICSVPTLDDVADDAADASNETLGALDAENDSDATGEGGDVDPAVTSAGEQAPGGEASNESEGDRDLQSADAPAEEDAPERLARTTREDTIEGGNARDEAAEREETSSEGAGREEPSRATADRGERGEDASRPGPAHDEEPDRGRNPVGEARGGRTEGTSEETRGGEGTTPTGGGAEPRETTAVAGAGERGRPSGALVGLAGGAAIVLGIAALGPLLRRLG